MRESGHLSMAIVAMVLVLAPPVLARIAPTASISVSTPQKVSLSLGLSSAGWGGSPFRTASGWVFRIEPGLSGGGAALGLRSGTELAFLPVARIELLARVLYTWNDPWAGLENEQSYAGLTVALWRPVIEVSLGALRHIHGDDRDHDWVMTAGLGLGI